MRLISTAPSATLRRISEAALRPSRCVVEGIVCARDDLTPISGALVQAFVEDQLRREMSLGEALTDEEGRFRLTFPDGEFRRRDRMRPHLVFRVFTPEGRPLREANVQLPANRTGRVNLLVRIPGERRDRATTPMPRILIPLAQATLAVTLIATLVWTSLRAIAVARRTEDDTP